MQKTQSSLLKGLVVGLVLAALLVLSLVLLVAYTGAYNVAASQDHSPFVRWVLTTTMENSVAARAEGLDVPELSEQQIAAGSRPFTATTASRRGGSTLAAERGVLADQAWRAYVGDAGFRRNA